MTNIRGDAQFILLIEKDAAFMRLAEDRFYNTYPCVIMTGKGQPDVATRLFLNKVRAGGGGRGGWEGGWGSAYERLCVRARVPSETLTSSPHFEPQ